ncbi:MAG TPA: trigger factor [Nitrospirae bacterium]|nr:trigger factor [bacterium BMS3Abin06]HDH12775.1 trigger factor [Nitrospirota bacterium]HDZ03333.1 trigger factor [Nitrospirota bacterium]
MLEKIEEISPVARRITIIVPADVIKTETDTLYNNIRATTNIPGFRPGKVPQAILTKRFGKNVEAQVLEKIVPEFYMKAIKETELEPVSYPDINEKLELKPGEPLSFTVTIEIKPELGDLNYEGIVLKEKTHSVEDDEVEKSIKFLQESKALYSVTEDELKEGDMAIVDSEAYINDELKEELTYKEFPFVLGSDSMPKEFSDALTGKKKGESVEVTLKFEDDNPNKTVAGKEILCKVSITETKKKNIPPLDDEFAKEAGCDNMDELRKNVREKLSEKKEDRTNLEYKKNILDELIKRHEFDLPASMVQGEIESLIDQEKQNAIKKGEKAGPDDELAKEFEAKAKENVKSVILLQAIGKKEKIEVSDEDIKKAIGEIAARNNLKPEEVTKLYAVREGSLDALKSRLFADKVLEFILEKSTIQ